MPCDNCGNSEATCLYKNRDYISGETFALLRCNTCGLTRTQFDFTQRNLSLYYDPTYYGHEGRRFPAFIEWGVARFREDRVKTILQHHPQAGSILDIGCGRGLMLRSFQKRGWEVVGTEFSAELAQSIQERYGFPVYSTPHLEACHLEVNSLDVVTLWHVLEHLLHPIQTLQEIARILKPQGILLIEVPNLDSWQAKVGRGRWFHLDCPRHLYHFSQMELKHILSKHGFRVLHTQTFSLEYGFYGFYQTLLNWLTWQPNVLYARLKKTAPAVMRLLPWQKRYDDIITLASLPLVGILGTILELGAVMANRGGITRIIAQKI